MRRRQVTEEVRSVFGGRLREIRKSLGLGVREAGRRIGISGPAVSLIETGKTNLSVERAREICEAYGHELLVEAYHPAEEEILRVPAGARSILETFLTCDPVDVAPLRSLVVLWPRLDPTVRAVWAAEVQVWEQALEDQSGENVSLETGDA
jgi:transcriptional regulator with XRE-family HTH domain